MFKVTERPIPVEEVLKVVQDPEAGALAVFIGTVRAHSQGREVRHLIYEAYPEMAEAKMREIGKEILERWGLDRVVIVHRVGRLEIGEISVVIAVGAAHRKEAFEACRYCVEALKAKVPIWKKEVFREGEAWAER